MAIQFLNTVAVDTSVLYVDTSSDRVGIGTTNPSAKLHVSGGTMRVDNTAPTISLNSTSSFPTVIVQAEQQGSVSPPMGQLRWERNPGGNGMQLNYYDGTTENSLRLDGSNFRVINNGSERMRIDSSGRVGIGTSNPGGKLEINGGTGVATSGGTLIVRQDGNTSSDGIALTSSNGVSHRMYKNASGTFLMGPSSNAEAFALDLSGNVGIGTTSPDTKLHVEGNLLVDAYNQGEDNGIFLREGFLTIDQPSITVWDMSNSGASPDGLSINANDGIRFRENGGEVARFKDGNFGIGTTNPGTFKLDVAGSARSNFFALRLNQSLPSESSAIYRPATGTFAIVTSSAERLRIGSAGQIGIGGANYGASGQVLTSNGSGSAPSWQAAGGVTNYLRDDAFDSGIGLYLQGGSFNAGTDTVIAPLVIDEEDFIYTKDGGYLRKLIGKTGDQIQIGQGGTSLISSINFLPGTAGNSAVKINSNTVWNAGNDGSGSGLDADLLDGNHASAFLTSESDTLATVTGRGASTTTSCTFNTVTMNTPVVGTSNKIKFGNNDFIRYDDSNGAGRFHFDCDGSTNNASLQAATFVGALSGNASTATKIKAGGNGPSTEDLNTVANSVSVGQLEYRGYNSSSTNKPPASDNANGVITVGQHSGNYNAQLAFSSDGNVYWRDNPGSSNGSWRKMWDEGNDGAGSGLNADLLDDFQTTSSGNRWGVVPTTGGTGVTEVGKYIDFHESDSHTGDYNNRITSSGGRLYLSGDLEVDGGDIYINDSNTRLTEGVNNSFRAQTNSGYIDIGPQNTSHCHIRTDRSNFYFDKELQVDTGIVRSYNEDLNLNRAGSSTARLRITSGTTYSDQLFYTSATGTALRAISSQATGAIIRGGANSTDIAQFQNSSGTLKTIINTNGYLGVNRTSASYPVDVTGAIRASNEVRIGTYGARLSVYFSYLTTNSEFRVGYAGGSYARCRASAFTVSSDYRLKENLETLENPIERLKELKVYRFNWKDKPDEDKVDGFIAHEVSDVVPDAVAGEKDGIDQGGEPDYQGIDHGKLVPLLTSSLQEAIAKIEKLEARIQTLENN